MRLVTMLLLALAGCGGRAPAPASAPASAPAAPPAAPAADGLSLTTRVVRLPGATGVVSLDYLAADRAAGRVWIPAGNTGSVDVLDTRSGALTRIAGFPTAARETRGRARVLGPSSATIGPGVVYIGNRATNEVCVIDAARLQRGACVTLSVAPDGLQYVAATREVWVTAPRDRSIHVLDARTPGRLTPAGRIAVDGEPEGYAVDDATGRFYTNLEDRDRTLAINVRTRRVAASWPAGCGAAGPRGLALDAAGGRLFVACTDRVHAVDAAGGATLSTLATGDGVDNIDVLPARGLLYVAAGKAGRLIVARVDGAGRLATVTTAPTAVGARVVVADADGTAYVGDPLGGNVLVYAPRR